MPRRLCCKPTMISSSPSMAETGGHRAQPRPDSHQAQTSIQTTHIRGAATTVQPIDRPGQKESCREEDLEEAPRSWARYLEDPDRTTRDQAPIRDRVRQDVPRQQHGPELPANQHGAVRLLIGLLAFSPECSSQCEIQ